MGRYTTMTPEQNEFLTSYLPELDKAKKEGTRLKPVFQQAIEHFLEKWAPELIRSDSPPTPEELKAKDGIEQVRTSLQ